MYKFMRRILAMTLALGVCMSVLVYPAAADSPAPPVTVTITVTEEDGSTTTTTTTTQSSTSTAGDTTLTQEQKEWESQNVKTDIQKSESENSTTTVDTNITTDKKGSQTTTTAQNSSSISGSTTGQETTDVTNTTTTTTVTKDVLISSEAASAEETPPQEAWVTTSTDEGAWKPGQLETGEAEASGVKSTQSETISHDQAADVTLNMSTSSPTDTQEVVVAASDVASGLVVLPTPGTTTKPITDDAGNVIGYKITTVSIEAVPGSFKVTTVVAQTGTPSVSTPTVSAPIFGDETPAVEAPQGYTPAETSTTETQGDKAIDTREVITEIKDAGGNVIGYTITTTTTTSEPAEKEVPSTAVSYILPEKPEASVTTDAEGNTTTVTVEEILEGGIVVGYRKNLVITDSSGKTLYAQQENLYQTEKTDSTQIVKGVDTLVTTETTVKTVMGTAHRDGTQTSTRDYTWQTTVNTTEDVYNQLKGSGELYVVYNGTMFQVTAGEKHGTVTMTSVQPNYAGLMPPANKVDTNKDLYHRTNKDEMSSADPFGSYDFQWLGEYGLESAIRVRTESYATGYQAHQFVLQDASGKKHYVYCADLMTSPQEGFRYNMENVFDASYYDSASAAQIQAIAVNGYWGSASGVGSLAAVKQMLTTAKANGEPLLANFDISKLTDGEALAATQAAIWVFGNSDTDATRINVSDPVGQYYKGGSTFVGVDAASEARVKALFDYLCKAPSPDSDTTTPLITQKNFATESSITVKGKATDTEGSVKTDASGKELYNTDVSFQLAIERSKLTGNLSVQVRDSGGNLLAEKYLVTNDSNLLGKLFADDEVSSDGTYVFRNLEIAAGARIDLTLSGTQDLGFGAYLYTAEVRQGNDQAVSSQTFVGLSEGQRQVNLSVGLQFDVTEPTHTKTEYEPTTRTDSRTDTKTDAIHQMKVTTLATSQTTKDWYGTVTTTNTRTEKTHSERSWNSSFFRQLSQGGDPPGDAEGYPPKDAAGSLTLADVPKTGDLSILWAVFSAASLAGYLLLSRKKKPQV